MCLCAAQFFFVRVFANGGFDQGRAGQVDAAAAPHQDHVVGQARQVGAARRGRAVDHRNLRNACGRQACLVGERAATIHKNLGLVHQVGATRFNERDEREFVFARQRLHAQGFFQAHGCDCAAFDGAVTRADDHAFACYHANARNGATAQCVAHVVVHAQASERAEFQKLAASVDQPRHPFTWQQLPTLVELVALAGRLGHHLVLQRLDFVESRRHAGHICSKSGGLHIDLTHKRRHYFKTSGVTAR